MCVGVKGVGGEGVGVKGYLPHTDEPTKSVPTSAQASDVMTRLDGVVLIDDV